MGRTKKPSPFPQQEGRGHTNKTNNRLPSQAISFVGDSFSHTILFINRHLLKKEGCLQTK